MDLKLKEKNEDSGDLKKEALPKRTGRSIAELASLSTLSQEELDEVNEEEDDEEYSDEYEENDSEYDEDGYVNNDDGEVEEENPEEEEDPPMEHYGKQFTFVGHPSQEDVFRFMFYHTYFSVIGVIAILIIISSIYLAVWSFIIENYPQGALFTGIFLFFIINSPLSLKKRAKKQSANMCSEEGLITYTFSEAGFDMLRQKEYASYNYDRIMKIVNGKTAYYVYLGKMRAFLAPKADLGENEAVFLELIKKNVKNLKGFKGMK